MSESAISKWPRIKQNLTPEMMFAIRFQAFGLMTFIIICTVVGFMQGWGWYGLLAGGFFLYVNSTYWAVYIKRGIDRRFQADEMQRAHAEAKAKEAAFEPPPGRLLNGDRSARLPGQPAIPEAPLRGGGFGGQG